MNGDHLPHDQGAPAGQPGRGDLRPVDSALRVAFERLLDQLDPRAAPEDAERRAARRLCGRWLTLRRAARDLTLADVARRAACPEQALELLELGLLDRGAMPEEAWARLCLVLEAPANNYEEVDLALRHASGAVQAPDLAFLQRLERQIPSLAEAEHAPAPRPAARPRELSREVRGILEALHAAGGDALSAFAVKKWLERNRELSLSPAVLPRRLAALAADELVVSLPGERSLLYAISDEGGRVLMVDRQRREAIERQRQLEEAYQRLTQSKPSLSGI